MMMKSETNLQDRSNFSRSKSNKCVTNYECGFYGFYLAYKTKEISCGPSEMLQMKCTICYNIRIFNKFLNDFTVVYGTIFISTHPPKWVSRPSTIQAWTLGCHLVTFCTLFPTHIQFTSSLIGQISLKKQFSRYFLQKSQILGKH